MFREIRLDPRPRGLGRWGFAWVLFCITLILVDLCATGPDAPGPIRSAGALGLLASLLRLWFKPYRCPNCGDRLKMRFVGWQGAEDQADQKPIYHDCPRCDIEWDSGMVWSRDSSD